MKLKPKSYAIYTIIAVIIVLMLVFGQQKNKDAGAEGNELQESGAAEDAGSGFIEVETSPKDADVFLDGANKGKSPLIIGNVPAGAHEILIKKDGYGELAKQIEVNAGRRTSVEAKLIIRIAEKEEIPEQIIPNEDEKLPIIPDEVAEMPAEKEEAAMQEETEAAQDGSSGKINLGVKFLLYYDFSSRKFEGMRPEEHDVFSKRYNDHLTFTRNNPAQMKVIDKNIADVEKEDCEGISGGYGQLASGQSVCVITKEGLVAAVGGSWLENTENVELRWKVFD